MDELKTKTMEVIDGINKDWTDTLEEVREYVQTSQAKNELDVSQLFMLLNSNKVMKNYSGHLKKLDQYPTPSVSALLKKHP